MKMTWHNGVLHLQVLPGQRWQPYTSYPHLKAEDHFLPKLDGSGFEIAGSQGYATMQKLLKQGWTLVKLPPELS
jgi:hypothetical protein